MLGVWLPTDRTRQSNGESWPYGSTIVLNRRLIFFLEHTPSWPSCIHHIHYNTQRPRRGVNLNATSYTFMHRHINSATVIISRPVHKHEPAMKELWHGTIVSILSCVKHTYIRTPFQCCQYWSSNMLYWCFYYWLYCTCRYSLRDPLNWIEKRLL